jgi:UDP-glucuronate 4-epimerase
VPHLVYASSSSVYGNNPRVPFSEHDPVDHPLSLYAATKRANELMAHSYAHLHALPVTGLRFFTVYGPWGRPDMAPVKFAQAISQGRTIELYNHGQHRRDFTFVDDIVAGVVAVAMNDGTVQESSPPPGSDPASSAAPFRIYNLGRGQPVALMDFLAALEAELGVTAQFEKVAAQPGDVLDTSLRDGVASFVRWFRAYYQR